MDDDDPAVESLHQLTSAWRSLVVDLDPAADVRDLPGLAVRWPDTPLLLWRLVALTGLGVDAALLRRRVDEAAALMRAKPEPGLLWVFTDLLIPDARDALPDVVRDAGFETALTCVGQAGDVLPIPRPEHPRLTFERVTTAAQIRTLADVNARANAMPRDDFRAGMPGAALFGSHLYAYLGREDGTPVTAGAAMEVDGRLFVLLVATAPESQRQGFGEAVTRHALYEAGRATGLRRAALHATEAGAPVYPRIGFVPNTPIHAYALAP